MTANNASDLPVVSDRLAKNAMRNVSERLIESLLFGAAAISVLTTIGIVYVLVSESIQFFQNVSIVDFLTDTQWTPLFDDAHFGIMVLVSGTVVSSLVALAVAIPMGTIIAIYLSEFANGKVREIAKPILELLGGIPTIVFGYFALLIVTPLTFLGGSFYSIHMLPPFWQAVTLFNPVVYLISAFRWSFYGVADVAVWISLAMTGAFLAAFIAIATWMLRTGYRLKN